MAIEIVDFPIKNGGSFHCYVSLPEDNSILWHLFGIGSGALNKNLRHPKMRPVAARIHLVRWLRSDGLSGWSVGHWKYPVVFPAFHSGIEWPWIGAWYSPFLENSTWIGEIWRTFRSIWQRFPVQFRKIQLVDPWMSDLLATSSILVA